MLGGKGAMVGGMTTLRLEARPFWLPGDCCLMDKWWAARERRLVLGESSGIRLALDGVLDDIGVGGLVVE